VIPCCMWAISERFRDKELIYKVLYKSAFFTFFYFLLDICVAFLLVIKDDDDKVYCLHVFHTVQK